MRTATATASWDHAPPLPAAPIVALALNRLRGMPIEHGLGPYRRALARIDAVGVSNLSDEALTDTAARIRDRVRAGASLDDVLPEFYAVARETCARALGLRPFDVQMMAAVALHQGRLAQMATGEGKTLVAVLPAALNALAGRGVHIFTANDYLARRDAAWMEPRLPAPRALCGVGVRRA